MTDLDAVIAEMRKCAVLYRSANLTGPADTFDRLANDLSRLSQPMSSEPVGEVVITTDESGTECYVVSRQDEEGHILSIIWEKPDTTPPLPAIPEGFLILPDDLWSHRNDWKSACQIACDSAKTTDDRMYWLHQIGTLAKIEVLATETAPVPAIPAAPAPSVVVSDGAPFAYLGFPSDAPTPKHDLIYANTTRLDGYTYRPIYTADNHPCSVQEREKAALGKQGEGA